MIEFFLDFIVMILTAFAYRHFFLHCGELDANMFLAGISGVILTEVLKHRFREQKK